MRGGARSSGGVRASSARTVSSGIVAPRSTFITGFNPFFTPRFKTQRAFPFGPGNFSCFGLNCFATDFFPPQANAFGVGFGKGFGFGIGRFGFGSGYGFGGYGPGYAGYGYGGYPGYSDYYPYAEFGGEWPGYFTFDDLYQQQQLMKKQAAERQRMLDDQETDERHQRELQRMLADMRATENPEGLARPEQPFQQQPQSLQQTPSAPTESVATPTVLVFRDHQTRDIRNYALTAKAVYEQTPSGWNKIPLTELDIPATIAANRDRGIQFNVPGNSATPAQ